MAIDDWETFKKSVSPIKNKTKVAFKRKTKLVSQTRLTKEDQTNALAGLDTKVSNSWGSLEKNILKKILKGKVKISSTLDLHGYSVNQSKKLVLEFIENNYKLQNRLILIISGKGKRLSVEDGWKGVGKLKNNIPNWLTSISLANKILWFDHAPPEKGGDGAFLIYLKKAIK